MERVKGEGEIKKKVKIWKAKQKVKRHEKEKYGDRKERASK